MANSEGRCGQDVFVAAANVAELSDDALDNRADELSRAKLRIEAMWSELLAETSRRHGSETAAQAVRDVFRSSSRQARQDVEVAEKLAELPETQKALADGKIPASHARLIARAAGEGPIDESVLQQAARREDYTRFNKTVRRHLQDMSDDDGQAILDKQKERRTAKAFESKETGMFVLSGEFDPLTGARIATVLSAKER